MDRLDQVLSQVKDEYSPDAAAKQRIRTQLAAALVAGGVASATQLAGQATAHGASATAALGGAGLKGAATGSGWLWFKAVTGVGLFAGLSVTSVHLVRQQWRDTERLQAQQLDAQQVDPRLEAQAPDPRNTETLAAEILSPGVASAAPVNDANPQPAADLVDNRTVDNNTVEPSNVAAALPNSKRHAPEPTPALRSSMLEEFSLLRQASQALRAGKTDEARRTLREHKRRFPASSLAPERNGLELLTSCSSGTNGSSRARAEHFLASSPSSPMAEAIRKQCLK
jgi:hypothetical protein